MKLLYLSEANLKDRLFIKDLVHNYKYPLEQKAILVHAPFGGTVRDTRFVTKRISTLLSETMVYNNAFGAEQRGLITRSEAGLRVKTELIERLLAPINLLILGPQVQGDSEVELLDPLDMLEALRSSLRIEETIVFTDNSLSPLGRKNLIIESEEQILELKRIYDEESSALDLALKLGPARLASPVTYSKQEKTK
ncbi:MAG: hypothetical protein AAF804_03000 [Bacteroidota bacterium]